MGAVACESHPGATWAHEPLRTSAARRRLRICILAPLPVVISGGLLCHIADGTSDTALHHFTAQTGAPTLCVLRGALAQAISRAGHHGIQLKTIVIPTIMFCGCFGPGREPAEAATSSRHPNLPATIASREAAESRSAISSQGGTAAAQQEEGRWSQSWDRLNPSELAAVQHTLLKVGLFGPVCVRGLVQNASARSRGAARGAVVAALIMHDAPPAPTRCAAGPPHPPPPRPALTPHSPPCGPPCMRQVSELIGRFTEGSADRDAPIHALRKALQLIAADCKAQYARCVPHWRALWDLSLQPRTLGAPVGMMRASRWRAHPAGSKAPRPPPKQNTTPAALRCCRATRRTP